MTIERAQKGLERVALLALMAFLVLVPLLSASLDGSSHNLARSAQMPLLCLSTACLAIRASRVNGIPVRGRGQFCWLVCGILMALSCASAEQWPKALREVALMLGLAGVCGMVGHLGERATRMLAKAIVAAWVAYAVLFVVVLAAVLASGATPNGWLLIVGFDNPRFLNHAQSVAIVLLAGVLASDMVQSYWRHGAWFGLIVNFLILGLSFGRSSMVALAAACVVALFAFGAAGKRFVGVMLLSALIGFALYGIVFHLVPAWVNGGSFLGPVRETMGATADHSRLKLWGMAVEDIARAPLLGIGPMHFAHHENPIAAHPHNLYLQVAAEFGLPFTLLVMSASALALMRAAMRIRGETVSVHGRFRMAALLACCAAAVDGVFSGNFVMPVSQVWIALAIGLLLQGRSPPASVAPRRWSVVLYGAAVVLQVWLAGVTLREFMLSVPNVNGTDLVHVQGMTWYPRYWMNGWF